MQFQIQIEQSFDASGIQKLLQLQQIQVRLMQQQRVDQLWSPQLKSKSSNIEVILNFTKKITPCFRKQFI
jgi:hypothetical protein